MTSSSPLLPSLLVASIVRVCFIIYGAWHDAHFKVKYTDIDYYVFTDAAFHVTQGESPYSRATYRYTPLLAWILTPNIFLHSCFGKMVFVLCDLIAGLLIFRILMQQGCSVRTSLFCAQVWLFNPLTLTISTRGNAESVMSVLVLLTLHCITKNQQLWLLCGSIVYALSVHVKIYPVTYVLTIYFFINRQYKSKWFFIPNRISVLVGFTGAVTFFALTYLCYTLYGYDFLHETYLYHVTRQDSKHNFSVYFYLFYLLPDVPLLSLAAFIPQCLLILCSSLCFYEDLPFTCFINTFVFVTFNKVCTSQYFLWYLTLLPLLLPHIKITAKRAVFLCSLWFIGQVLWLAPAYYLEFEGKDTFLLIWAAGLLFFAINVIIIINIIQHYDFNPHSKRRAADIPDVWTIVHSLFCTDKVKSS